MKASISPLSKNDRKKGQFNAFLHKSCLLGSVYKRLLFSEIQAELFSKP